MFISALELCIAQPGGTQFLQCFRLGHAEPELYIALSKSSIWVRRRYSQSSLRKGRPCRVEYIGNCFCSRKSGHQIFRPWICWITKFGQQAVKKVCINVCQFRLFFTQLCFQFKKCKLCNYHDSEPGPQSSYSFWIERHSGGRYWSWQKTICGALFLYWSLTRPHLRLWASAEQKIRNLRFVRRNFQGEADNWLG